MASAGRILIMPKGSWKAETEYEMLDLVYYHENSWVARQPSVGIAPSADNSEYWQRISDAGHRVAFKIKQIECAEGNTDYMFEFPELANRTIIGAIHSLGYPLESWGFTSVTLHQNEHFGGVIRTDKPNTFYVYCTVFYK